MRRGVAQIFNLSVIALISSQAAPISWEGEAPVTPDPCPSSIPGFGKPRPPRLKSPLLLISEDAGFGFPFRVSRNLRVHDNASIASAIVVSSGMLVMFVT